MIKTLHLQDFTAFADLQLQLGQGVNVLVGENGTGKTLLLKTAYALGRVARERPQQSIISRIFTPSDDELPQLRRNGATGETRLVAEFTNGRALSASLHRQPDEMVVDVSGSSDAATSIASAVFIPSKEVLSLARRAAKNGAGRDVLQELFDDSHLDVIDALLRGGADMSGGGSDTLDPRYVRMQRNLINLIGGDFRWRDGDFYLHAGRWVDDGAEEPDQDDAIFNYNDFRRPRFVDGGEVCGSALSAEGFRKIGMLQRLIANGTLSPAGGVLLWDEPEANLNPKLACMVVNVMLHLADTGYQVILATHDSATLEWLDLLAKYYRSDVRFHALYRESDVAVMSNGVRRYYDLEPNPISAAWRQITGERIGQEMEVYA